MPHRAPLAAVGLVLLLAACPPAAAPPDTTADVAAIQQLTEREMTAFSAADINALTELVTPDAILMPPNEPAVHGLDAVRAWAEKFYQSFSVQGRYTSIETRVVGDIAYQWLEFELTVTPKAGGDPIRDVGKGVHVLQRRPDGTWRIVLDSWNSSQPLPAVPRS
jgi:uncharacterized protein (TIGR02246 family)